MEVSLSGIAGRNVAAGDAVLLPSKTVALNVLPKHRATALRASKPRNVVIAEHARQILLRLQ